MVESLKQVYAFLLLSFDLFYDSIIKYQKLYQKDLGMLLLDMITYAISTRGRQLILFKFSDHFYYYLNFLHKLPNNIFLVMQLTSYIKVH
jgi:hypothetical protein